MRATRVGVVSASVPFVRGGAEMLEEALVDRLEASGVEVVHIRFPFVQFDAASVRRCMAVCAAFEMPPVDRVVALKFPCWLIPHRAHVPWVFHQFRAVYDLWEAGLGFSAADPGAMALKELVTEADTHALGGCGQVWTYSQTTCDRLLRFNGLHAGLLYSPMPTETRYRVGPYGDYVVALGRVNVIKRQSLAIEALALTRRPVRLILAGVSEPSEFGPALESRIQELHLKGRVRFLDYFISEQEKVSLLENALASIYVPVDEDNFGYVTAESYLAQRPVVTFTDSGGVRWLVENNETGLVTEPTAAALAAALDALFDDRALAGPSREVRARPIELFETRLGHDARHAARMKWGWQVIERASDPIRVMDAVTMCSQIRQHGLDVRWRAREVDALVVVLTGCADDTDVEAALAVHVPTVLVDLRESPMLPRYRAHRWFPEAVVAGRTALAVAYRLATGASVWATAPEPDEKTTHDKTTDELLLCTGHSSRPWESTIIDVLDERTEPLLLTGGRRHEVAALLRRRGADLRVADGNEWLSLSRRKPKLVILLPGSPIVPDLPLALGHAVASHRAPVGVDWWLVPTLEPRTVAGRSAATVTQVLDDHVLRNWLTAVCAAELRAHVRLRPLDEAVVQAMRHVEQRWAQGASWAMASWLRYLDDGDLSRELSRWNAARDS